MFEPQPSYCVSASEVVFWFYRFHRNIKRYRGIGRLAVASGPRALPFAEKAYDRVRFAAWMLSCAGQERGLDLGPLDKFCLTLITPEGLAARTCHSPAALLWWVGYDLSLPELEPPLAPPPNRSARELAVQYDEARVAIDAVLKHADLEICRCRKALGLPLLVLRDDAVLYLPTLRAQAGEAWSTAGAGVPHAAGRLVTALEILQSARPALLETPEPEGLSPSRTKARAAYDWALMNIDGAEKMTVVQIYDAIMNHPQGPTDSIPGNAEAFGKYLRDAGVKRYDKAGPRHGRSVCRSDEI